MTEKRAFSDFLRSHQSLVILEQKGLKSKNYALCCQKPHLVDLYEISVGYHLIKTSRGAGRYLFTNAVGSLCPYSGISLHTPQYDSRPLTADRRTFSTDNRPTTDDTTTN